MNFTSLRPVIEAAFWQDIQLGGRVLPEVIDPGEALEIICFPRPGKNCRERVKRLLNRGVRAIVSYGEVEARGIRILGKGFSSIVVAAIDSRGRLIALKIRRQDSRRDSLVHEAKLLLKASRHRLAPRVYWWERDFIAMEYIQGVLIQDIRGIGLSRSEARILLARILGKAFVLDMLGIDHGELSRPYRHIIIRGLEPFFLDFESASAIRRPHNLPALVSALLLSNNVLALYFKDLLDIWPETSEIVECLRIYKVLRPRGYRLLLERLGLL